MNTLRITAAVALAGFALAARAQSDLSAATIFSSGYRFEEKDGQALYEGICQGCHMPDAQGASGAGRYPALAADARLAARQYALLIVLHGSRAMPAFAGDLDDEQIAAVVNYVRTHFGNHYADRATAGDVKALRGAATLQGE